MAGNAITVLRRRFGRLAGMLPANLALRLDQGPLCTVTFDDCCRSAVETGGSVLERFGAAGTYFVSASLLSENRSDSSRLEELRALLAGGHEIGCHTYRHRSVVGQSRQELQADVLRNARELARIAGVEGLFTCSYPFGEVTYRAKRFCAAHFAATRGIRAGLNHRLLDLSELRAVRIYHRTFSLPYFQNLVARCRRESAWLIFYTHDVAEDPSPWGCTPDEFESVVRMVVNEGIPILTMKAAIGRIMFRHPKNAA
jgi:peptidoglycan/xylan/chitin deacetylase (PgdA/CDA1 family)